jgi:type IV secretory pathway TrbF-like protein
LKIDPAKPAADAEQRRGKRRAPRDAEPEQKARKTWKERDGFVNGARVRK